MDNFILEIPNVFSPELCKNIINKFENDTANQVKGALEDKGGNYVNEDWKSSTELMYLLHLVGKLQILKLNTMLKTRLKHILNI